MTAIEDVMRAVLDARAKVYETARATVEDDPGYLRDRADRARATRRRIGLE